MFIKVFKSKFYVLSGSDLSEIVKLARHEYHTIQLKTPRRSPYIRSRYFIKDKIFISSFWEHINQKSPKERVKRLKLYLCAIDLLRNTTQHPVTIYTHTDMNIGLHRFYGLSKDGIYYCVQIKENKRTSRKDFISVFPIKKLP